MAKDQETMWRLVFQGGMSKADVWDMKPFEILVANEALNNYTTKLNESIKSR